MRRFILLFASCVIFYGMIFYGLHVLTDVAILRTQYPHVIYDPKTKDSVIVIKKTKPANWVNIGAVNSNAIAAIVLSEDWAFYQHNGFDWQQIWGAFQTNLEKGKFVRGGSTITQQVVKNVFLSSEKTIWRKLQEAVLTFRIERELPKKRILEIYLNIAEFGEGLYGVGAASHKYFGKPPSDLNAKEGAFLAMLLPSPKKYSISFRKNEMSRYASSTVRSILQKLLATHRISQEQYESYMATPFVFEKTFTKLPSNSADEPVDEEEDASEDGPIEQDSSTNQPESAI